MSEDKKDLEQLIVDYETAKKGANRAGRCIAGILLLVLTVNALFLIFATRSFMYYQLPEFWVSFGRGMEPVTVRHMPRIQSMFNRLYPVYTKAFHDMAVSKLPKMKSAMLAELEGLEAYGRKREPEIRKELDKIAAAREADFVENLEKLVGRKVTLAEQRRIATLYKNALAERASETWPRVLLRHQEVIPEIERSLERLIRTEPELDRDIQPREAIGILLEFLGVEIQAGELQ